MRKFINGIGVLALVAVACLLSQVSFAKDTYIQTITSADAGSACSTASLMVRGSYSIRCDSAAYVAVGYSNPDGGSPSASAASTDVLLPAGTLFDIPLADDKDNKVCEKPVSGTNNCYLYIVTPQSPRVR
jgi:hypothetical protein